MTVSLKIEGNPIVSQGQQANYVYAELVNDGDENVMDLFLKVIDGVVFDNLVIYGTGGFFSCLNVWSAGVVKNFTDSNTLFPAGTTKAIKYRKYYVKESAPVTIHTLTTYMKYTVY